MEDEVDICSPFSSILVDYKFLMLNKYDSRLRECQMATRAMYVRIETHIFDNQYVPNCELPSVINLSERIILLSAPLV